MGWAPISLAAASRRALFRPVIATRAPLAISISAIPFPMPLLPPVTSTVVFCRFILPLRVILTFCRAARGFDIRQERSQKPDGGQERADAVYRRNAGRVGEPAEHRCAQSCYAESQSKKQAGDGPHPARNQLLRINHDRR